MQNDDFTPNELLVMYLLVYNHISENIDMIDSGDYGSFSKNELIANNALCNSMKRKLAKRLKSAGIDPAELIKKAL